MIESFRTALLITLSILVVVIAVRRLKQYLRQHHMPIPQHVRLLDVQVMYHPERLHVRVKMPRETEVRTTLLSSVHEPLKRWPSGTVPEGEHVLELPLEAGREGVYYLEIATDTQRTERRFTVRQA